MPSAPPTDSPTESPTESASEPPTESASAEPTETPSAEPTEPAAELDPTKKANSGSVSLDSGFAPDPHTVSITSGGSVDASYLNDCAGFATPAPDYEVEYTAGDFSLLRFYFVGDGDTTLIINGPDGAWYCNDDFSDDDPLVDFESPDGGTYDIWVGSYASGEFISGTLSVTESSANQP